MKIALGIIALLLVGLGVTYALRDKTPAYTEVVEDSGNPVVGSAAGSADPFEATITFTGEAYEPADITIKKGTRVRFVNESDTPTWPASAVHPTHSIYPEKRAQDCLGSAFDSCRNLQKGEFFDYTFNYVGEWRFHDHSHAYYTGSVTVQE